MRARSLYMLAAGALAALLITLWPCIPGHSWWFCFGEGELLCACDNDFRGQSPGTRWWLPAVGG